MTSTGWDDAAAQGFDVVISAMQAQRDVLVDGMFGPHSPGRSSG